jgi:hypothetical protein
MHGFSAYSVGDDGVEDGLDGGGRGIGIQARLLLNVDKLLHSNSREINAGHWNAWLDRFVGVLTVSDKDGRVGSLKSTSMRTGANPAFSMVCSTHFRVKNGRNGSILACCDGEDEAGSCTRASMQKYVNYTQGYTLR